ncbi:regulatory LuxR family protein [Mucilaginibacter gracilis]|uniref:Regulatory LuxR family protein n=1 Tax=Mucilaginibacter gracilis TaxID=423350 RepID=A0A495J5R6_9SPHI|nr:helix-turn-helix transcriptional regulator [Mucilaginibacter gracilis]RKR83329.1 regulatory LuxR family protein [Mucilaginibacter gracilis]
MNISELQMHWLALAFIILTAIFLVLEVYDVLRRPKERWQWWNLVLVALLFFFNVTNGNFPDESSAVSLKLQYLLSDGSSYLVGAYFPFYFYKMYELDKLRFHAVYGAPVFVLLPFLVFEVVLYNINGQLTIDRQWGVMVPAVYGLVALMAIVKAIIDRFQETSERSPFIEALAVWLAVLFWEMLCAFPFFTLPQWLKLVVGNLGLSVVTIFLIVKHIRRSRREFELFTSPEAGSAPELAYLEHCVTFGLTKTETEVALLVRKGWTNRKIADHLFRTEGTIKNHLKNIFKKTEVATRSELIHLLEHGPLGSSTTET